MFPDYYAFPAFLYYDDDGISIEFPDLPGCLPCADTTEDAFRNAREALGLHLFGMEQDGEPIPEPTPIQQLAPEDGAVVSMVEVFMPAIRERMNTKVVKKTLTIPAWLNALALENGVNFSQVLQEALKARLHTQS
jgi:predicted RNase H-like HicB family nuclease